MNDQHEFKLQGLNKILEPIIADYVQSQFAELMQRHALLEKTHAGLMELPSVKADIEQNFGGNKMRRMNAYTPPDHSQRLLEQLDYECKTLRRDNADLANLNKQMNAELQIWMKKCDALTIDVITLRNTLRPKDVHPIPEVTNTHIPALFLVEPAAVEDVVVEEETVEVKEETVEVVEEETEEVAEEETEEVVEEVYEEPVDVSEEPVDGAEEEEEETPAVKSEDTPAEEEEADLEEIEIDGISYCTDNCENGGLWVLTEDGDQGEKVGYFKDGDVFFYEDEQA